jgi:hypothetical protein
VRKIISILLALGLILGLTMMATPALTATCPYSPQGCTVTVKPAVECEVGCYNITFNTSSVGILFPNDWIQVTFPSCAVGLLSGANVTINGGAVTIASVGLNATTLRIILAVGINASAKVTVMVCNVTNCVAGNYSLSVRTEADECACDVSYTIATGGKLSPTELVYCIGGGKNLTTGIIWGSSTSVKNVTIGGVAAGTGNFSQGADNATLNIAFAWLDSLSWPATCTVTPVTVDFDPGCNVTLNVTVAYAYNVTLTPGWNLISLPVIPIDPAITAVLKGINSSVSAVWYWNGCAKNWSAYKPGSSFNSLTTMDVCSAYWICNNATSSKNLTICGYTLPCPPLGPPCCCYCDCWNMVGYFSTNATATRGEYLTNMTPPDTLIGALSWNGTAWQSVGNGTTMIVGRGYWMAFLDKTCIVPPL